MNVPAVVVLPGDPSAGEERYHRNWPPPPFILPGNEPVFQFRLFSGPGKRFMQTFTLVNTCPIPHKGKVLFLWNLKKPILPAALYGRAFIEGGE
jgi:hypothetical protein